MSLHHMDQSDQSEKSMWLTTACCLMGCNNRPRLRKKNTDVNTLYQVTAQRREEIVGNDEKHQMKTSQKLCAFSMNAGLRAARGRDLAQSSGKKIASAKGRISSIYTQEWSVYSGWGQNVFLSGTSFWFSLNGFVAVIMDFLRTVCLLTTGGGGQDQRKKRWTFEYIYMTRVWARQWLIWNGVSWCDWASSFGIGWLRLPRILCLCLSFYVCQWVCFFVWDTNLISPQPSSTIILIDPHLFWTDLNPLHPDNFSSNFYSPSNPSLSLSPMVVWPTGQASSYLLCLCHTPLLLVLPPEIWTPPMSPWQPSINPKRSFLI